MPDMNHWLWEARETRRGMAHSLIFPATGGLTFPKTSHILVVQGTPGCSPCQTPGIFCPFSKCAIAQWWYLAISTDSWMLLVIFCLWDLRLGPAGFSEAIVLRLLTLMTDHPCVSTNGKVGSEEGKHLETSASYYFSSWWISPQSSWGQWGWELISVLTTQLAGAPGATGWRSYMFTVGLAAAKPSMTPLPQDSGLPTFKLPSPKKDGETL